MHPPGRLAFTRRFFPRPTFTPLSRATQVMADVFADRLLSAIRTKGAPICVGIDPIFEMLPDDVAGEASGRDADDYEAAIDAIFAFTTRVLKVVAPLVP